MFNIVAQSRTIAYGDEIVGLQCPNALEFRLMLSI